MPKNLTKILIIIISLWLYLGTTNQILHIIEIPLPIFGLILLVLILLVYSYLTVRNIRSFDKNIISDIQNRYEVVYAGTTIQTKCVVAASPFGITVFDLGQNGTSVEGVVNIPFNEVRLEQLPEPNPYSDLGAGMVIKNKSSKWSLAGGFITVEQLRSITPLGYLKSRITKNANDSQRIISELMAISRKPTGTAVPHILDQDKEGPVISGGGSESREFIKIAFGMFGGLIIAGVAAFLTVTLFDSDYQRGVSSLFTTCVRDSSAIKTLPVNKSTKLTDGATLTVHNVTYNVPQDAERPQETNAHFCSKATLVEVTVNGVLDKTGSGSLSSSDFVLEVKDAGVSHPVLSTYTELSTEQYASYTKRHGVKILELQFLPKGTTSSHGWLVFSVKEGAHNKSARLIFNFYENRLDDKAEQSISLPDYR